jgi:hypothetical protein
VRIQEERDQHDQRQATPPPRIQCANPRRGSFRPRAAAARESTQASSAIVATNSSAAPPIITQPISAIAAPGFPRREHRAGRAHRSEPR